MKDWYARVRASVLARGAGACGAAPVELGETRCAVCAAFSYLAEDRDAPICRYARGRDYHRALAEALEPAAELLRAEGHAARVCADISPLPEVETALRAGLGMRGRNGLLIVPGLGSWVVLGCILTSAPPPEEAPPVRDCRGCGACLRACPTGALTERGVDPERCLSAVTQRRGALTPEEEDAMRRTGTLWGCDVCQSVCPENRNAGRAALPAFREELIYDLTPAMLAGVSERGLRRLFPERAFTWRGAAVLRRNAEILHGKNAEEPVKF